MEADVCTLRDVVKSNSDCAKRFKEAETLAKKIFKRKNGCVPLPFFTEHGIKHCKAVEKYLNEIIWKRKEESQYDFNPNAEEAMYLLSAVWLHDIGMWYGLWDGEDPKDLPDVERVAQLREDHEERTLRYIQQKWDGGGIWSQAEKEYLSNICFHHRSKHPINVLEPSKIPGSYVKGVVHLSFLAALLRLADAWHIDETRAPAWSENFYISLGMPQEAKRHWKRAGLIRKVEKDETDQSSKKIKITGHYPRKHTFGFGEFDLKHVGDVVCEEVRNELRSVEQTLSQFTNTSFTEVKHEANHMALAEWQELYLTLWPYLLDKLSSSTETTVALAEVLLFATQERAWRSEISNIIEKIRDSHPYDFMINNLCKDVEVRLGPKSTSAKTLARYLKSYKSKLKANCDRMAGHAVDVIKREDFLFVYGYSSNTLRLIEEVQQKPNRHLYIVECFRKRKARLKENEDERIKNRVIKLNFASVRFVPFQAFAQALAELQENKNTCKLLLGTHGMIEDGKKKTREYICKTGSRMVATVANESEVAEVIVFAETEKVLRNGLSAKDIAGSDKLFSWDNEKRHPELGVMYLPPTIDKVPTSVVDYYVNEKGVFDVKNDWRVGFPVSGRKASSLT